MRSYQVDPAGVVSALRSSIDEMFHAFGPDLDLAWSSITHEPRLIERLGELQRIAQLALERRCLSAHGQKMLDVIHASTAPVTPIFVIASSLCDNTSALKQHFLQKLGADCNEIHAEWIGLITQITSSLEEFDQQFESAEKVENNLDALKRRLFRPQVTPYSSWKSNDQSVRWVKSRDTLESIELIIGLIQKTLSADHTLSLADFGLLLPRSFDSHSHLKMLFDHAGLPLANLRWTTRERNLVGELLSHALMAFEGGCPRLALNSLMSNPLMPWSRSESMKLISKIDRMGLQFDVPEYFNAEWKAVLNDIRESVGRGELAFALTRLKRVLKTDTLNEAQLSSTDTQFSVLINAASDSHRDYESIRKLMDLSPIEIEQSDGPYLDGIMVWYEDMLPWRQVKRLFVLDFMEGNFPSQYQSPAVFSEPEWGQIFNSLARPSFAKSQTAAFQRRFVAQLCSVQEQAIFFCPAFDFLGKSLNPSESLIDCALVAGALDSLESLTLDLREPGDLDQLQDFKLIADQANRAVPRYSLTPGSIDLDVNLLAHLKIKQKDPATDQSIEVIKPQSPSALDDLLLCPLAWFLKQIGAENRVWEPEGFTPATSGLIAHEVMEKLFANGQISIPSEQEIEEQVGALFTQAIKSKAPYLNTAIWRVERQNLLETVRKAALAWAELLIKLDATVVAPELWLEGTFDGHPIHGQTDCVIALPDQGVLVVDFKNSKASKYEKRMKGQLDLQASLYEQMLKTGGPKEKDIARAAKANLKKLNGVVYYTLKDRLATSNYLPPQNIPSWHAVLPMDENGLASLHSKDVSSKAMGLLKTRFDQLREGMLVAISQDEIKQFEKEGFGQYIFESSPLVKAAILDIEEYVEEDDE